MDGDDDVSRVILRELTAADEEDFLGLARASVGLHHPWYTLPTKPEAFEAYLARLSRPGTEGRLVCLREGGAMAGVIIVDSIIRGRFQSASLSYAAFAPAAGRGYMSEGLSLVLRYAFGDLRTAPAGSQYPAGQPGLTGPGPAARLPQGGLLPRHAVHRRGLAGS